ncbi:MAG: HD domain-containing protein, partial [Planctomycetota bacterium]
SGESNDGHVTKVDANRLDELTNEILGQSTERLVKKYHLSLPEADSLGPALMAYHAIASELKLENIFVAPFSLRDGIIEELASGGKWPKTVDREIIRSAVQLGRQYNFDYEHAIHVSRLAMTLFEQLSELHELGSRFEIVLEMAAILHEIGVFVSNRSYHKHSMYLIRNSEFFGISRRDLEMVALVARYHRRATPQPNHDAFSKLNRGDRVSIAKMASILRIAKALDASRYQRIKEIKCEKKGNKVVIRIFGLADISLETLEMGKSGQMFSDLFGVNLSLELGGER